LNTCSDNTADNARSRGVQVVGHHVHIRRINGRRNGHSPVHMTGGWWCLLVKLIKMLCSGHHEHVNVVRLVEIIVLCEASEMQRRHQATLVCFIVHC
jgi:hypothetical protein